MDTKQADKKKRLTLAYKRLFMGDDGTLNEDGKLVLSDMMAFARFYKSIMIVSPASQQTDIPASFNVDGRREMVGRVMDHLSVPDLILFNLQRGVKNE